MDLSDFEIIQNIMAEYMLDTSAIGEIADGAVNTKSLFTSPDDFYVTHIQEDEIAEAGNYAKFLFKVLDVVDAAKINTEAFMWGISRWGEGKWGAGDHIEDMLTDMGSDDGNEKKDVLIAETAVQNSYILVTHDGELRNTVNQNTPGTAISIPEFESRI